MSIVLCLTDVVIRWATHQLFFTYGILMYPNFFSFILPLSQAALRAAKQTKDGRDEEIAALRSEIEVECANLYLAFPLVCQRYTF